MIAPARVLARHQADPGTELSSEHLNQPRHRMPQSTATDRAALSDIICAGPSLTPWMPKSRIASLLSLLLVLVSNVAAQTATPSRSTAAAEPGVLEKVEKAVVHGAKAAASGVERGVKAAEHGAKVAASGVERGVKAAASGIERGAQATDNAAQSVAKKVGTPAKAASQASK